MIDDRIRIKEIALAAGVSPSTVSRVINKNPYVKEGTRTAVLSAMRQFGMPVSDDLSRQPNKVAKNKEVSNNVILAFLPQYDNIFHYEILKGVDASAKAHGYHVVSLVGSPTPYNIEDYLSMLRTLRVQGVVTMNFVPPDLLRMIADVVPVVQCCEYSDKNFSYVSVDDFSAAKNAVEYILSTGHRRVGFVNSNLRARFAQHRYKGFLEAMNAAGITVPINWIVNLPNMEYESAVPAITQLLTGNTIPDAIFAVADVLAIAAINVAHTLGIRVPEDLIVVGFDDVSLASMSSPALTTVCMPRYQLGYTSAEVLIDKITLEDIGDKHVLFNAKLVIRGSSSASNADRVIVTNLTRE